MEASTATAKPSNNILQTSNQANQILLNAIKTKFASSLSSTTSTSSSSNDSKALPPLKLPITSIETSYRVGANDSHSHNHNLKAPILPPSKGIPLSSRLNLNESSPNKNNSTTKSSLNSFLRDQLNNNKHLNGDTFQTNNGFILPKLPTHTFNKTTNDKATSCSLGSSLQSLKLSKPSSLSSNKSESFHNDLNNGVISSSLSSALKNKLNLVDENEADKIQKTSIFPPHHSLSSGSPLTSLQSQLHCFDDKIDPHDDDDDENLDLETSSLIDLSIALNTSNEIVQMQQKILRKTEEKFDIPFIDCDKRQDKDLTKDIINQYCQLDISEVQFNHYLKNPSKFGQVFCSSYKGKDPPTKFCAMNFVQESFSSQPIKIKRFLFDTKSPDDKVKEAMEKYKRS